MVFHAFGDRRSAGETKFPAALLITTVGRPISDSILSIVVLTASESLTSQLKARTRLPVDDESSEAVFSRTLARLVINYMHNFNKILTKIYSG